MHQGWFRSIAVCAVAAALAGCASIPSAGPTATQIASQDQPSDGSEGYVLIDIDQRVSTILASEPQPTLYGAFTDRRPRPDIRVGVGDGITVTIWEAAAGGLFSAATVDRMTPGSRTATIPEQIVAQDGTIRVPYAGRVKAAGMRPAEIEREVNEALRGKAIEPQAVVAITRNVSNTVTVTGEVTNGMQVPLTVNGDRILSIIAAAGGIRAAAHESFVRLTRKETTASVAFNKILSNPRENIFVRPGDVITVVREPQTFSVFGGTLRNESFNFDATGITLEQALAKSGGLLDNRADASGVFLLRYEPTPLAARLQPQLAGTFRNAFVPVMYRLNLRDANSYFLASSIPMHNRDILYVASAPMNELQKVVSLIGQLTQPVVSGASVAAVAKK